MRAAPARSPDDRDSGSGVALVPESSIVQAMPAVGSMLSYVGCA